MTACSRLLEPASRTPAKSLTRPWGCSEAGDCASADPQKATQQTRIQTPRFVLIVAPPWTRFPDARRLPRFVRSRRPVLHCKAAFAEKIQASLIRRSGFAGPGPEVRVGRLGRKLPGKW